MEKPTINISIPVHNEEGILAGSLATLTQFLALNCHYPWKVVIANNGSQDRTQMIAEKLCHKFPQITLVHVPEKGRGRALKKVWSNCKADILCYMDCDLSTELAAFPPLIEALVAGGCDLATGSRLLNPSLTTRCLKREILSRGYNFLIKAFFGTKFSDSQCGFKAITRKAADELLPMIEDTGWFFDTELLVVAEKLGYRIFDLPVSWVESPDSHVKIIKTAYEDLKGLIRVYRNLAAGKYKQERGSGGAIMILTKNPARYKKAAK